MASQAIKNKFLINAPAGSGKTTSIRNHLKSIYMEHPESKVLCITYTNRAADELKKDLESPNITVSTIHSYINDLIKPFFGQTEAINLYWELYGRKISERIENSNGDERIAESNQHYIEKFGSLSLDIVKSNIDELSYGETPFTSLYTGKLSHDDLLMFAYYLIKKYPVILRKISDKYNYIFIDEYQDTSAFILKIFYEAVKDRPNIMLYLLGDRMQQIYHNYDGSFEEQFKEFDTSKKLDTNHRSIGEIISILNRIYNDNRFDQNPSDKNRDLKPDIPPKILVSSDIKETVSKIQANFPNILTLYLMNKEKYEEIGAQHLYECYNSMETYSFGRKYSPSDVLSDLSEDNPDPLMRLLFFIDRIMRLYCNENYGTVISSCKKQTKYLNVSRLKLQRHVDKKAIKDIFDKIREVYYGDNCSIKMLFDCLQDLELVKEDFISRAYENTEYNAVFDVQVNEIRSLVAYLSDPYISTQHGVKGESHTSVVFVANDNYNNPNVRMYAFFELWSSLDFSLPEFEDLYYSYAGVIAEVEKRIGMKTSDLTKETHNQNEATQKVLKEYSEQLLQKYKDNKIFEAICQNDYVAYLGKPTVSNAKKIFKLSNMEGILTAYKLFYVGCSRARKNLLVIVEETKISKFKDAFIAKVRSIGFDDNDVNYSV